MEVVFWKSNVFKNNPVETRNQKLTLLTVKSKYDTLMKMSNEPKKDDELKKSSKKFKTSSSWGKEKWRCCFTKEKKVKVKSLWRKKRALLIKEEIVRHTVWTDEITKQVHVNPIQHGFFRGCSRMGRGKKAPLPKILHTYPTMMKLGTVIPYPNKIRKIYESRDTLFEVCWHQHFLPDISRSCYIKKYLYRLYFDT